MVGNVSFCDNSQCMYHNVDIPEDKFMLELDVDDAPNIIVDVLGKQPKPVVHRYVLYHQQSKRKLSFCQYCKGAIDMVMPVRMAS